MLSREKIRMMAQAAVYEKQYYRKDMFAGRYYKNDYIGLERLKTKIWMTIFFAMYVAAHIFNLVYIEQIDLLHYNYKEFAIKAIVVYLALSLVISLLTSAVYGPRYERANRRLKAYYDQLEKINLKG